MSFIPPQLSLKTYLRLGVLALILLLAGYGWYQKGRADRAKDANKELSADAAAGTTFGSEVGKIYKEKKVDDQRTEAVLARNPEWSSQPIPPDVADLLRHPTGAAQAVP
mgnify:CR=1 FL=1